MHKMRYMHDTA